MKGTLPRASAKARVLYVSENQPRSSPKRRGVITTTSGMEVRWNCMWDIGRLSLLRGSTAAIGNGIGHDVHPSGRDSLKGLDGFAVQRGEAPILYRESGASMRADGAQEPAPARALLPALTADGAKSEG